MMAMMQQLMAQNQSLLQQLHSRGGGHDRSRDRSRDRDRDRDRSRDRDRDRSRDRDRDHHDHRRDHRRDRPSRSRSRSPPPRGRKDVCEYRTARTILKELSSQIVVKQEDELTFLQNGKKEFLSMQKLPTSLHHGSARSLACSVL